MRKIEAKKDTSPDQVEDTSLVREVTKKKKRRRTFCESTELKVKFINSDLSVPKFAEKYNLDETNLYRIAREQKWLEYRKQIRESCLENLRSKFIEHKSRQWEKMLDTNKTMDDILNKMLEKFLKGPMLPKDFKALTSAHHDIIVCSRLLTGEDVGIFDGNAARTIQADNVLMFITEQIAEHENKFGKW